MNVEEAELARIEDSAANDEDDLEDDASASENVEAGDEAGGRRREDPLDIDTPLESTTLPASLPCPFCESENTEVFSSFGGQASTCQYYCNDCRTVFEAMRWR